MTVEETLKTLARGHFCDILAKVLSYSAYALSYSVRQNVKTMGCFLFFLLIFIYFIFSFIKFTFQSLSPPHSMLQSPSSLTLFISQGGGG